MKDYNFYSNKIAVEDVKKNKKKFIENFDREGDTITIDFAASKKGTVKYNKENVEKLLAKMEEQYNKAREQGFFGNAKGEKDSSGILAILMLVMYALPVVLGVAISLLIAPEVLLLGLLLVGIIGSTFGSIGIPMLVKAIKAKNRLSDFRKTGFFLKHKKYLNENVLTENKELKTAIFSNISNKKINKLKAYYKNFEKDVDFFDINNIDYLSLRDLTNLKQAIDMNLEFKEEFGTELNAHDGKRPKQKRS